MSVGGNWWWWWWVGEGGGAVSVGAVCNVPLCSAKDLPPIAFTFPSHLFTWLDVWFRFCWPMVAAEVSTHCWHADLHFRHLLVLNLWKTRERKHC